MLSVLFLVGFCLAEAGQLVPDKFTAQMSVAERRVGAIGMKLDRFETVKGRAYFEVLITAINDGGISIRHASGTARLSPEDLREEQKSYFGIDVETAKAVHRQEQLDKQKYINAVERIESEKKAFVEKARRLVNNSTQNSFSQEDTSDISDFRSIPSRPDVRPIETRAHFRRNYSGVRSYYYSPYYYSGYYPRPTPYRSTYGGHHHRGYCHPATLHFTIR